MGRKLKMVPPTIKLKDAAAALGVCRETIRLWTRQGRFRFIRTLGGQRRLYEEDVIKALHTMLNQKRRSP